ncbi:MAG: glycosyltransferase [Armatimonadota bacterium]|nr:glycosyltransferase [Armatimonadota bacterium]
MTTAQPLVSIGMPVYNGERYLRQVLDNLLGQDYQELELIISDNASTDATQQICMEYQERDGRIRYSRNATNIGIDGNFNRVFELASGEYFMWAAADDLREPCFVSKLTASLEADPGAVLAFGAFDTIDEDGVTVRTFKENWSDIFSRTRFWQYAYMVWLDPDKSMKAQHIHGLIRTEALRDTGGLFSASKDGSQSPLLSLFRLPFRQGGRGAMLPTEGIGEDHHTLLRLLTRGRFVIVEGVLFHFRIYRPKTGGALPLLTNIVRRLIGSSPEHRGNLWLLLVRNHLHYHYMRHIILHEALMSLPERVTLCILAAVAEVWTPFFALSGTAFRQLRNRRAP